jgi:hypothetical protein
MEIGPIPGIRSVGAERTQRGKLDPPAIFDVEGAAKPGDRAVQRTGKRAAGAEENEEDDLVQEDDDGAKEESAEKNVDYFA